MTRPALVLLGSNMGDRAAVLRRALAGLARLDGTRLVRASRVWETAPVGPSDAPYLNQAALLRTSRTGTGLLVEFKRLEAEAGRRPGPRWGARPLDVDLVELGRERLRTPWLSVPHPLAASRAFAVIPLADVAPAWRRRRAAVQADGGSVKLWK